MSKRDFNDFQPTRLDRRLGAALLVATVVVLVGLGVDAAQGPALAEVAPAPATVLATSAAAGSTVVAQAAQGTAAAGR